MSSSPTALFGRSYSLILSDIRGGAAREYTNVGSNPAPLRVVFSVARNVKSSPNKAAITVYNLSAATRGAIGKYSLVTLAVGYGTASQNLFLGVVQKATTERQGADILTKLECGDGEAALTRTKFNKSYEPGVLVARIIQDCAELMSLATATNPTGLNAGIAMNIPRDTYAAGYAHTGTVRQVLDEVCGNYDLEWSIQNGALDIVPRGFHAGNDAIVLSAATGLLGVPAVNDKTLTFSSLINPAIAPNRLVKLESQNTAINGFYKVNSAKYDGDTHQAKWQVDCEASLMPGQRQAATTAQGFNYLAAMR